MRRVVQILMCFAFSGFYFCGQAQSKIPRGGLAGNNIPEFIQDKNTPYFTDPIDDTIHFKRVIDQIYRGDSNKIYLKTACFYPVNNDTLLFLEYYKDISEFLDLKTYGQLPEGFFQNKHKVYMWWGNSDGEYPMEVKGADPKSFVPFKNVGGGTDKNYVFYGGGPSDFEIIQGANPKTVKVLNPKRGCWNCGDCYFVDDKFVFYGFVKIEGADPKTFKLLNKDKLDAKDTNGQYFEGKRIN
jgi:hypothetical protein